MAAGAATTYDPAQDAGGSESVDSEELHELETYYKAGMPNSDGIAFPERVNMLEKLNTLEAMRVKLRGKAPTDMRDEY